MVDLQARAFVIACAELRCAGIPIYSPDVTPPALRTAIANSIGQEVEYLGPEQMESVPIDQGVFADGGVYIFVD